MFEGNGLKLKYYDVGIIGCIVFITLLGLAAIFDAFSLKDWFLLGIGITVSTMLFIIALRIDKSASLRLFALLDPDRRLILEYLASERTYDDLKNAFSSKLDKLPENLEYLKDAKLVREREEIISGELVKFYRREL